MIKSLLSYQSKPPDNILLTAQIMRSLEKTRSKQRHSHKNQKDCFYIYANSILGCQNARSSERILEGYILWGFSQLNSNSTQTQLKLNSNSTQTQSRLNPETPEPNAFQPLASAPTLVASKTEPPKNKAIRIEPKPWWKFWKKEVPDHVEKAWLQAINKAAEDPVGKKFLDAFIQNGGKFEVSPEPREAGSYTAFTNTISLGNNVNPSADVATVVHELGHAFIHIINPQSPYSKEQEVTVHYIAKAVQERLYGNTDVTREAKRRLRQTKTSPLYAHLPYQSDAYEIMTQQGGIKDLPRWLNTLQPSRKK